MEPKGTKYDLATRHQPARMVRLTKYGDEGA